METKERSLSDLIAEQVKLERALKALKSAVGEEGLLMELQLTAQLVKIHCAIKEWEIKSQNGSMPI